jgi:VWFA-related protein
MTLDEGERMPMPAPTVSRHCGVWALVALASSFAGTAPAQQVAPPASGGQLASQSEDASPSVILQSETRRVLVDVVVVDGKGQPVHDLKREDFTLSEDKTPQKIVSFDPYRLDAPPEFIPPKVGALPPNTFVNLPNHAERGPLYVIVFDMVNTELPDQSHARAQLMQFLAAKPEGVRYAVYVLSNGLHLTQGFTSDKNLLLGCLDSRPSHPHVPKLFLYGGNYGKGDPGLTAYVLLSLAHSMEGISGRKNVIWMTGHLPMPEFPSKNVAWEDHRVYTDDLKEAADLMARSQISIYPLDVRGVVVNEEHAPSISAAENPPGDDSGSGGAPPSAGGGPLGASLLYQAYGEMDELADTTGGRAAYSRNDIRGALDEITSNGGNYYTLSYSPSNRNFDGNERKIEVSLDRKGYRLSYRKLYYPTDASHDPQNQSIRATGLKSAPATPPIPDAELGAMRHGAPMAHDLVFKAHVRAVGAPAMATTAQLAFLASPPLHFWQHAKKGPPAPPKPQPLQAYEIEYTLPLAQLRGGTAGDLRAVENLEVSAAAYDVEGNVVASMLQQASASEAVSASEPASSTGRNIVRFQHRPAARRCQHSHRRA